jgi:hypothetical protein
VLRLLHSEKLLFFRNFPNYEWWRLSGSGQPQNRTGAARENLNAALALVDDLIGQSKLSAAAVLGRKGGASVAKRGSEYFSQLAAKRKTRAGGRPRKET